MPRSFHLVGLFPRRFGLRQFTLRQGRRALAIALLALVGGGFSAHAALIVMKVAAQREHARAALAAGFDTQDHFPGAALLYANAEQPAPTIGATGTTALPDLPLPPDAALSAGDGSVHPARPFSLAGAGAEAQARAQQCLTAAIYYEAASESDDGERAVAQVILNRVRHPAFPASVCGVVYQGSERTTGCQFSFACDGSMARVPSRAGWSRAARFANEALHGAVMPAVGEATHYHTYAVTPSWNRSLVMTAAIGAHFFHRWQGWWGTPAAFSQRYALAEPLPGPHARPAIIVTPGAVPAAPPVALATRTPAPFAQPAYADSGLAKPAASVATDALPESTILDRWKDTGRALR